MYNSATLSLLIPAENFAKDLVSFLMLIRGASHLATAIIQIGKGCLASELLARSALFWMG